MKIYFERASKSKLEYPVLLYVNYENPAIDQIAVDIV